MSIMSRRSYEELIRALPDDVRDRVVERAAILWESGMPDDEANHRAYELETGRALLGLARARVREPASAPRRKTGSSD
jgi:hypothetical protein